MKNRQKSVLEYLVLVLIVIGGLGLLFLALFTIYGWLIGVTIKELLWPVLPVGTGWGF